MEGFVKLSTAVNITILMVDSTDHVTGKTGLAAGLTIYATKAAGTPATITPTVTELDSTNVKGVYKLALTSSHTDTLGEFQLHITATGADPADYKWQVATYLPGEAVTLQADQAVNVSKWSGSTVATPNVSGVPKVDVVDWLGSAPVTPNFAGVPQVDMLAWTGTVPNPLDANANAPVNVVDWKGAVAPAMTGDAFARLGAPAVTVSADIAAVKVDTAAIKVKTDQLVFTIANKVDSSIQAAGDFAQAAADKVWLSAARTLTAFGFSVTIGTNNDKTGYTLSGAGIQAIFDALTSGLTTVGSIGKLIKDNLDATVSSRLASASYTAPDNASITAIKAKTDNLPASPAATGDIPTAAQNAAGLLDLTDGIETNTTVRQGMRLWTSVLAGKISGAGVGAGPIKIRNRGDTKDRLTVTSDADGNRTAITYDVS